MYLGDWFNEPHIKNAERRLLLYYYVTVLGNSGLRPGTETDHLQWKHVRPVETADGEKRYVLSVEGKTGKRNPVVSGPGYQALVKLLGALENIVQVCPPSNKSPSASFCIRASDVCSGSRGNDLVPSY